MEYEEHTELDHEFGEPGGEFDDPELSTHGFDDDFGGLDDGDDLGEPDE
jgi:hypothetical protein